MSIMDHKLMMHNTHLLMFQNRVTLSLCMMVSHYMRYGEDCVMYRCLLYVHIIYFAVCVATLLYPRHNGDSVHIAAHE